METLSKKKAERSKFLIGLNFYGYDYTSQGGHPVLGKDYLDLVGKSGAIQWGDDVEEHYFEVKYVFFKTPFSIEFKTNQSIPDLSGTRERNTPSFIPPFTLFNKE